MYCCLQVTIRKPLGLVLGEAERGGAVVVEEIVQGGNAEQTGVVQVGDVVSRCGFDKAQQGLFMSACNIETHAQQQVTTASSEPVLCCLQGQRDCAEGGQVRPVSA